MINASVGNAEVLVANNGNHSPEEWAAMATDQLIFVGGNSHPVIVDQARAYKDQIYKTLTYYFKLAQEAERNAIIRRS